MNARHRASVRNTRRSTAPRRCGTASVPPFWRVTEWGVTDEAVLSAIASPYRRQGGHDPARQDPVSGRYDQCRADRPGEKLRKLEMKDLDAAMLAALRQTNGFVLSEGKPLDPGGQAPPTRIS